MFEPVIGDELKMSAEEIEMALINPNASLAKLHVALLKVSLSLSLSLSSPFIIFRSGPFLLSFGSSMTEQSRDCWVYFVFWALNDFSIQCGGGGYLSGKMTITTMCVRVG